MQLINILWVTSLMRLYQLLKNMHLCHPRREQFVRIINIHVHSVPVTLHSAEPWTGDNLVACVAMCSMLSLVMTGTRQRMCWQWPYSVCLPGYLGCQSVSALTFCFKRKKSSFTIYLEWGHFVIVHITVMIITVRKKEVVRCLFLSISVS